MKVEKIRIYILSLLDFHLVSKITKIVNLGYQS